MFELNKGSYFPEKSKIKARSFRSGPGILKRPEFNPERRCDYELDWQE
jgi:hypothetical protein